MSERLDRYANLVDDHHAFKAACSSPLEETCWMPPGYRDAFDAFPAGGLTALRWTNSGFSVHQKDLRYGVHFLLGGLLVQEEAAMMAVGALAPRPGERILDLCAAPGNKTVQLAKAVGSHGCVIANDVSASRLQILRGMVDRFRLSNVYVTVHDGASFPERSFEGWQESIQFDAVLVDVPCSCEGTCRKNPSVLSQNTDSRSAELPGLQQALLKRAIRLTRPGGRILYATCTFAPEENEMVVDRVLKRPETGNEVQLESVDLPDVKTRPGITSWNGTGLHPTMERTVRIWPHHNDTGGFFLALLRKEGQDGPPWPHSQEAERLSPDVLPWSAYDLDDDFLKDHATIGSGRKHNRLVGASCPPFPFNVVSSGMSGLNLKSNDPRPSSALATLLGSHATAGIAEVSEASVLPFIKRESVLPESLVAPNDRTRFVLVRHGSLSLGLGHVNHAGRVESLFPTNSAGLEVAQWLERLSDG